MDFSNIFLNFSSFENLKNKLVIQEKNMKKKYKKKLTILIQIKSFYFEDYLETNNKNKFSKKNKLFNDRIYLLFFLFFH